MSKKDVLALLSFIVLAFIAYRDCFGIFIPGDNYSELSVYAKQGFNSIVHTMRTDAPFIVSISLTYFFYTLFGVNSFLWIGLSVTLHAFNAFLVYLVTSQISSGVLKRNSGILSFSAALLFVLSPYQSESVIWAPTCIKILLSTLFTLSSLVCWIKYLFSGKKLFLILFHTCFLLAVFSYEMIFIYPLVCLVLTFFFQNKNIPGVLVKKNVYTTLLIPIALILLYFLVCKLWLGEWLWHGGVQIAIKSDFLFLAGNLLKYLAKFFLMYRYWNVSSLDEFLRENYTGTTVIILALATFAFFAYVFNILVKKDTATSYLLLVFFVLFLISLIPVLPLDSSFLGIIYSDRYGYFPSVFFYVFLSFAVYLLLGKAAKIALLGIVVLFGIFLSKTIPVWKEVSQYSQVLINGFESYLKYENIYILNIPTYFKGVAAFRSAFAETIYIKYNQFPAEKIRVISGCYQQHLNDTLVSVAIHGDTVAVYGQKKKTPFFSTDGGWPRSYETNAYKVIFDTTGCKYLLVFKEENPKNSAIIYVHKEEWKKAI